MAPVAQATEEFAEKINAEAPWWVNAPIWLAAGIVGVPALIAIGAGYFIARNVTLELEKLDSYQVSEIAVQQQIMTLEKEHQDSMIHNWHSILRYVHEQLQVDYAQCVNAAADPQQRKLCLTPSEREDKLDK